MSTLFGDLLTSTFLEEIAGHAVRRPLSLVTAGGGPSSGGRRHLFLVEQGASRPFAIAKRLDSGTEPGIDRARLAMQRLRDSADPLLIESCPRSWGPFALQDGSAITIQAYVAGPSMHLQERSTFRPRLTAQRHFARVAPWLTMFGEAFRVGLTLDEPLIECHFVRPLQEYVVHCGDAAAAVHVDQTIAAARRYLGQTIHFTAEHGDFWPSNILVPPNDERIYVVDWEHYSERAPAGFDPLFFCMTYALDLAWRPLGWVDPATALRRAFIEPTWFARIVRDMLHQYCAALGVEPALLPLLLEVLFARMALRQHESIRTEQGDSGQLWSTTLKTWWSRTTGGWLDVWAAETKS